MSVLHVEFCAGGPVDGRRQDVQSDNAEAIRVYTPRIGMPVHTLDASDISSSVGMDTHVYRRTRRLTKTGYELYAYAGKEHR
jgi:hypothetical protein